MQWLPAPPHTFNSPLGYSARLDRLYFDVNSDLTAPLCTGPLPPQRQRKGLHPTGPHQFRQDSSPTATLCDGPQQSIGNTGAIKFIHRETAIIIPTAKRHLPRTPLEVPISPGEIQEEGGYPACTTTVHHLEAPWWTSLPPTTLLSTSPNPLLVPFVDTNLSKSQ